MTTALLCLILAAPAWGDTEQRLASRLARTDSLEGEFEQRRQVAVLAAPLLSRGTFRYQIGSGILWRTTQPVASEVRISREAGVLVINDEGHARPLPASELVASIFVSIFSGDLDQLGEYFTLTEEPCDNGWSLRLVPRQTGMARHMESIVLSGSAHVERVEIRETNGDRTELLLQVTADSEAAR